MYQISSDMIHIHRYNTGLINLGLATPLNPWDCHPIQNLSQYQCYTIFSLCRSLEDILPREKIFLSATSFKNHSNSINKNRLIQTSPINNQIVGYQEPCAKNKHPLFQRDSIDFLNHSNSKNQNRFIPTNQQLNRWISRIMCQEQMPQVSLRFNKS